MSKRMKLLAWILAGSISVGTGFSAVEAAQRNGTGNPVAGVSGIFMELLAEAEKDAAEQTPMAAGDVRVSAEEMQTEAEEDIWPEVTEHEAPVVKSEYADIAVAQVNNYVNVRSEPTTESEILGKLYHNSAATVLETTEDGWYRIQSGNVNGYVKAEYVVVGDEELAKEVSTRYATVTTTTLFVRSEPTTEAKILTMLPEGDDLEVLDESLEGWLLVSTVEGEGYICSDYVTLATEYVHAESKEEEEARLAKEEAERQAAAAAAEAARKERERLAKEEEARKTKEAQKAVSKQNNSSVANSNANSSGSTDTRKPASSNGQAVVDYARQFLGNPYVYGGNSLTNGTDCSGFVKGVYAAFGVSLPRTSAEQRSVGYAVSLADIKPGDIVCYSGHVGIYAGNDTLIHASNEKTGITLTSPVTYRKVLAVRRIF